MGPPARVASACEPRFPFFLRPRIVSGTGRVVRVSEWAHARVVPPSANGQTFTGAEPPLFSVTTADITRLKRPLSDTSWMQRPTGLLHGLPPDLQAPRVLELLGDVRDPEEVKT